MKLSFSGEWCNEQYALRRSLSSLEEELSQDFFKVGRVLIVNLRYIRKVSRTQVYLAQNIILSIPRGAYEPLNRSIIRS